ncbi:hypothetical protein Tco_1253531 [Tanacetum coccineum]
MILDRKCGDTGSDADGIEGMVEKVSWEVVTRAGIEILAVTRYSVWLVVLPQTERHHVSNGSVSSADGA